MDPSIQAFLHAERKSDPELRRTSKATLLKKANLEKDPEKRELLKRALRGRLFD